MKTIKVSPSDFAFLYEDCKRCFWLKCNKDMVPPSKPMASIFNRIDKHEKAAFQGGMLSDIHPSLPRGRIVASNVWCQSTYVEYPELNYQHYIKGVLDSIMQMEDGSYQIIDFKTSDTSAYAKLYEHQLHAYAYSLLNPMNSYDKIEYFPISGIGLIIFDPDLGFEVTDGGIGSLKGTLTWKPLEYSMDNFIEFMHEFAKNVASDEEPDFSSKCPYCNRDKLIIESTKPKLIVANTVDDDDDFKKCS